MSESCTQFTLHVSFPGDHAAHSRAACPVARNEMKTTIKLSEFTVRQMGCVTRWTGPFVACKRSQFDIFIGVNHMHKTYKWQWKLEKTFTVKLQADEPIFLP